MFWSRPGYAAGYGAGRRDRAAERDLDAARHLSRALFGAPQPAPVVYSQEAVQHLLDELEQVRQLAQQNHDAWQQAERRAEAALDALYMERVHSAEMERTIQDLDEMIDGYEAAGGGT